MPQIVSIVGRSNSGKTTLIEKLIPELRSRGYKIGIIKHSGHRFDFDKEGKDTWRHRQAGADTVIAAGPGEIALIKNDPYQTVEDLETYCRDMDLIITEGFKQTLRPKIEVYRNVQPDEPLFRESTNFIAVITDAHMDTDIPVFGLNDVENIADFIENRFLRIDC